MLKFPNINKRRLVIVVSLIFVVVLITQMNIKAIDDNNVCLDCHNDKTLSKENNGKKISLYINPKIHGNSVHGKLACKKCHTDINPDELPHAETLKKVDCAICHTEAVTKFNNGLHASAKRKGIYLTPSCYTCHGKHDIQSSKNPNSKTYPMNIPTLCGSCHKEGTAVSKLSDVSEKHVLENYSESIHGEGLFKRGLIVTAVCTSCHNSHDILPHENPSSSINRNNIPKTCMRCHTRIENVHQKVINGELWEKKPHAIPICVDCHQPHKVRKVLYDRSYPNTTCLSCHSQKQLHRTVDGKTQSLFKTENELSQSMHKGIPCIKCHTNVNPANTPICSNSGKVDCSMCHAENVKQYKTSTHGNLHAKGNPDAPYCTDCHGKHNVKSRKDVNSPTFQRNIPGLCGGCHQEGQKATRNYKGVEHEVLKNYSTSIHGKGLIESGLIVTATCVDCHTSHMELPADNPKSTVNHKNVAGTCGNCHLGIAEKFKKSIHSPDVTKTDKKLPVCNDCHFSHTIKRVEGDNFRKDIIDQCGKCHKKVTDTYFDTFHGKVSKLGSIKTAKCYDCHGAHDILPTSNPKSKLSRQNIIETCKKCHPNSNRKFVGYLTHATHHEKDKYPFLYYTFWFMTSLLVATFGFFGLHTLLWIPRGLYEKRKSIKANNLKNNPKTEEKNIVEDKTDDVELSDNSKEDNGE